MLVHYSVSQSVQKGRVSHSQRDPCKGFEEFQNEFAQGYCERASDEFWPPAPLDRR